MFREQDEQDCWRRNHQKYSRAIKQAIKMAGGKRAFQPGRKKHLWPYSLMSCPLKLARNPFQIYYKLKMYSVIHWLTMFCIAKNTKHVFFVVYICRMTGILLINNRKGGSIPLVTWLFCHFSTLSYLFFFQIPRRGTLRWPFDGEQ